MEPVLDRDGYVGDTHMGQFALRLLRSPPILGEANSIRKDTEKRRKKEGNDVRQTVSV